LEGEAGVKPRSPKGRAVARGLDARIHFQHPFIPAGDTPPKSHQPIKIPLTVITVSTAIRRASLEKDNAQADPMTL
jgi:hypothetical protein